MRDFADKLFASIPVIAYPEGSHADAIEREVMMSLPKVEGLDAAVTQEERVLIFSSVAAQQRAAFVERHGNPFGCEHNSEPRPSGGRVGIWVRMILKSNSS